jgi:hypothetical protein
MWRIYLRKLKNLQTKVILLIIWYKIK